MFPAKCLLHIFENAEFEDLKKKCEALQLENRQISVKNEREKEQLRVK
jgi:hypothetical protein